MLKVLIHFFSKLSLPDKLHILCRTMILSFNRNDHSR